jgi:hypothetical protein
MILGRSHGKHHGASVNPPGLALHSRKTSILIDYQIVARVVTKRHQDLLALFEQGRHDLQLCDISYRLAVPETRDRRVHYGKRNGLA